MVNGYTNIANLIYHTSLDSVSPFGNVQVAEADFDIPLDQGQSFASALLHVGIGVTPVILPEGAVVTVILNGNSLGNITIKPDFSANNYDETFDVGFEIKSKGNVLSVKCDSLFNNITWLVDADLSYTLNTPQAPSQDINITNPPTGNQSSGTSQGSKTGQYLLAGLILAGVAGGLYLVGGTEKGRNAASGVVINLGNRIRSRKKK